MQKMRVDTPTDTDPADANEAIHERNGIWVVTIDGVWRGDYTKREHAVAAVEDAQHDGRARPR